MDRSHNETHTGNKLHTGAPHTEDPQLTWGGLN